MTCEGLIAYKLVQIPATYLHVTLVIIQTCGESLSVCFTASCSPIALISRIGGLGRNRSICSLGFGRTAARTSAKKSSDGVTDRRANCYTTAKELLRQNWMAKQCGSIRYIYHRKGVESRGEPYAAVDAICTPLAMYVTTYPGVNYTCPKSPEL